MEDLYKEECYKKIKRYTAAKAIRNKCLDCCGYQEKEVKLCTSYLCPLWRWRMGTEERDNMNPKNYS